MIISHEHKFIFVRTRKTASTSVETALAQICGPDDVISPIGPGVDGEFARNYDGSFVPIRELLSCTAPMDMARVMRDFYSRPKFYDHMRASSIKSRVSSGVWNDYYKFCFERNPWDKTISFFYWIQKPKRIYDEISEYLFDTSTFLTDDRQFPTDWCRYSHRNQVIVDDVFDYGDLEGSLKTALRNCGVRETLIESISLPRFKSETRDRKRKITFDGRSFKRVEEIFSQEISHFDYKCPEEFLV